MIDVRRLLESALALMAVWLLVRHLPDFAATAFWVSTTPVENVNGPDPIAIQAVRFATSAASALLLLGARKPFAAWLLPTHTSASVSFVPLLGIGFAVLGGYFLLGGVTGIATHFSMPAPGEAMRSSLFLHGAWSAALGLVLVVVSPFLGRAWGALNDKLRTDA